MDKPTLDDFVYRLTNNIGGYIGQSPDISLALQCIGELTKDIYARSASVPEFKLSNSILEILCQMKVLVFSCGLDDDELSEIQEENKNEPVTEWSNPLEMYINPTNMFLNGKIRPDIVFRKGAGNYVIIEVDSFLHHSNQNQLMADKIRERKIQSLGHPVFRFAAKEILNDCWGTATEVVKILQSKGFVRQDEDK